MTQPVLCGFFFPPLVFSGFPQNDPIFSDFGMAVALLLAPKTNRKQQQCRQQQSAEELSLGQDHTLAQEDSTPPS